MKSIKFLATAFIIITTSACANYQYKEYKPDAQNAEPLDLSNEHHNPALVYLGSGQFSDLGFPYHRLLLATHLNDKPLDGAGYSGFISAEGYQALKVAPGHQKISFCWVSRTHIFGGVKCDLNISGNFQENKKYMINWRTSQIGNSIYLKTSINELENSSPSNEN